MKKRAQLHYRFIPELSLIIDSYKGNLTLDEILRLKCDQALDPLWKPYYNTLSDMRDTFIDMTDEEIKTLAGYQINDERWREERKTASLTNGANHVVFEALFNHLKPKNTKVMLKAFSTLEAAIFWLDYGDNVYDLINDTLTDLRNVSGIK